MKKTLIHNITIFAFLCLAFNLKADNKENIVLIKQSELKTFSNIAKSYIRKMEKKKAWEAIVPEAKSVIFKSTADGSSQPALFYNSGSDRKKPLLLALHSWSEDYRQHYSIPYGVWAVKNDWVLMQPDYRGPFTNMQSTASELAVQDILDAVEYAKKNALVDDSRVYIIGFSGGAMATLIMAARFPDIWAGAAAWVPVYDLLRWYQYVKKSNRHYTMDIINSCGGIPLPGTDAGKECIRRSPAAYLKNEKIRKIPVYIATGIMDSFVPPEHSIMAFNDLAEQKDRITDEDIAYINKHRKLPAGLRGAFDDVLFSDAGHELIFERTSGNVTLKIFQGRHDIIYNAGLYWLSLQKN